MLDALTNEVRASIERAIEHGADGILYQLYGAEPGHCSPMQYGGHFLDRDRELLGEITDATANVLFVVGGEGTYLDFLSDLPAHVFAWDSLSTGVSVADIRAMRNGALATQSPEADILLLPGLEDLTTTLEKRAFASL